MWPHTFFVNARQWQHQDFGTRAIICKKQATFADISISKVLHSVQSVGLLNAYAKGRAKDRKWSRYEGRCRARPAVLCTVHHLNLMAGESCSAVCVAHSHNKLTVQPVWYSITDHLNSTADDTTRAGVQQKTMVKGKGKAVPLQAWSGPEGSRKLRFPDFMPMAWDGGMVDSLTHRPPLLCRKYSWPTFLLQTKCHSAAGKMKSTKNSNDTIRNRTHNLPACSTENSRCTN